jgi:phosphoribosylglycinamide formyltransferase 2
MVNQTSTEGRARRMKRIMLLGSGELGKEFVISVKRLGHYVIAVDSYDRAPAMQVADRHAVCDMLNPDAFSRKLKRNLKDILSGISPLSIILLSFKSA